MRFVAAAFAICGFMVATGCTGALSRPAPETFWGVNESGMEFGHGMKAGTNYVVPDPNYYLRMGMTLVRLPLQIDRLVTVPGGALNEQVVSQIRDVVAKASASGAITVIDPHGYGFMNKNGIPRDILKDAEARADYVDMMGRIAAAFRTDDVAIGLMNEPHTGPDDAYAPIWNEAITAIRKNGYHGVVLVPHAHWSAARDISVATPYTGQVVDPDHRWVLELHSYLDPDGTGTYRKPVSSVTDGADRLAGAIDWSRKTGTRIFLGETGGPPDPVGLAAFTRLLEAVHGAPDVFWGIAVWGAGPWWKSNYPMRLDPLNNLPRPQFTALQYMLTPETIFLAKEPGRPDQRVGLSVDGTLVPDPVVVSADRTGAPQAVPIRIRLAPGTHQLRIVPKDGGSIYLLGTDWKGASNGKDAFGPVEPGGRVIHIMVPQ